MIKGMRAKATRERVIQRLYEMALARANDAVKLAYCQEPTEDEIRRLDLGAVAEFRRSNLGSVEIRFIDRVKALQALAGMLEGDEVKERLKGATTSIYGTAIVQNGKVLSSKVTGVRKSFDHGVN